MSRAYARVWISIAAGLFLGGSELCAFEIRPAASVGLMQQPASQYYHLVEGGSLDVSLVDSWSVRATYFERPIFRSAGYVDQDIFAYAQTGSSFFRKGPVDLYGYLGAGRCWGYIKEEEPKPGHTSPRRNDYVMNAIAFSMEAAATASWAEVRLGHSLLVGRTESDAFASKVAWPFTIFYLSLTVPIIGSRR